MTKTKKNLLSGCALVMFALFALSSAVNKIHYGAFNYGNHVEDPSETRNYALMNDGTKVYGEKIAWKTDVLIGIVLKNQIKVDDQKFKITEVKGYQTKGTFYGRLKNSYIKRIVHGKLNVYVQFSDVTTTSTDHSGFTHTSSYVRTDQYVQKGEDGPFIVIAGQEDIKKMVSDCPLAVEMCDKSNSQLRKAIRKDGNYLNSIFDVYNNGCKTTK
ncbi:MAG TPA: hypothetical protein VK563_15030 [Puia sp.]|nr:hypothetical protein [Puia sp.]